MKELHQKQGEEPEDTEGEEIPVAAAQDIEAELARAEQKAK